MTYRGRDFRNPHSYNTNPFTDPTVVAWGLALFTLATGFACVLVSLLPGG